MRLIVITLLFLLPLASFSQVRTLSADGNWSAAGSWTGGIIATTVAEDVNMNNNVDVTILNGESFNVGNLTGSNNNSITINAGGTLILGASGNLKTLNAGNNLTINVAGNLTIYGDLTVPNNLTFNVTGAGSVTITGNVTMMNNSNLVVSGTMAVGGNFSGGANTHVTVNAGGLVNIAGTTSVGGGTSSLGGAGTFHSGGACTGPAAFCGSGTLPLTLVSFSARPEKGKVIVKWSTESELNVDYFTVQRSVEGVDFHDIGTVSSNGVDFSGGDYSYLDAQPVSGKSYYRLKEVDRDGKSLFLKVVPVDFLAERSVVFYPNPVSNGQLSLSVNFDTSSSYRVSIHDLTGRVLKEFIDNQQDLKMTLDVSPGLYFVRFESHDYHTVSKIMVK